MPVISLKSTFIWGIAALSLFTLFILKSCEKEKYQHPIVHTGEVTNITSEGATFHGRITQMGSEEIVDHGFVWGMMHEPNLKNSNFLKLGKLENETFNAIAQAGFINKQKFYLRAFVSTPEITVYGGVITFISKGGKSHEVIDFEPKEGTWGDTITITGNYFNQDKKNIVLFDSYKANIIKASNNELKVIVPKELDKIYSKISVNFHDYTVLHKDSFYILPPIIDSISPVSGNNDTFITVFSKGFHMAEKNNRVFLDTIELDILKSYRNRIVTNPSFFIPHGEHKLKIKTLGQKSKNHKIFFKIEPWTRLPDTEFNGYYELVYFSIGNRLFAGKADVTGGFYEYIPATNEWIKMTSIPFTIPSSNNLNYSVSANSKGHIIRHTVGELYSYCPSEDQWINRGQLPYSPLNTFHRYSFSVADDIYIGTHLGLVWKYSSDSKTWTQLNNNPFQVNHSQGFAFDGYGYVVGFISSEYTYGILKYDHYSDSWSMVADFSDISINNIFPTIYNCIVWSMENNVIILHGSQNNMYDLLEFLPKTNELVFHGQVPINRVTNPFRFSSGNRGYLGSGKRVGWGWAILNDFWEFDLDRSTF